MLSLALHITYQHKLKAAQTEPDMFKCMLSLHLCYQVSSPLDFSILNPSSSRKKGSFLVIRRDQISVPPFFSLQSKASTMALLNNQTTTNRHRSGSMSMEDEMMFVRGRVFEDDDVS